MIYMNQIRTLSYAEKFRDLLHHWGFSNKISIYIVDFSDLVIVLLTKIHHQPVSQKTGSAIEKQMG